MPADTQPPPPSPPPAKPKAPPLPRSHVIALWLYVAMFLVFLFDVGAARTRLITSIDRTFLIAMMGLGAVVGAGLGWIFYAALRARQRAGLKVENAGLGGFAAMLSLGLLYAGFFNHAAWRIAETYSFWGSTATISRAAFPIVSYRKGKSELYANLGGLAGEVPVSRIDYALLETAGTLRRPWSHCLRIARQEQGGAARIFKPAKPWRTQQTILPCPKSVQEL
jgi:hypothetical protein